MTSFVLGVLLFNPFSQADPLSLNVSFDEKDSYYFYNRLGVPVSKVEQDPNDSQVIYRTKQIQSSDGSVTLVCVRKFAYGADREGDCQFRIDQTLSSENVTEIKNGFSNKIYVINFLDRRSNGHFYAYLAEPLLYFESIAKSRITANGKTYLQSKWRLECQKGAVLGDEKCSVVYIDADAVSVP